MGCYTHQEIFSNGVFFIKLMIIRIFYIFFENKSSDNFCQQLETISSVLPWISPGNFYLFSSITEVAIIFILVLNPLIYSFFGQNFRRQTINIIQRYMRGERISHEHMHVPSK